jgi:hypothetical protein
MTLAQTLLCVVIGFFLWRLIALFLPGGEQ